MRSAILLLALTSCILCDVAAQTIELRSARVAVLENSERDRFLTAHNAARNMVYVPRVAWSDELSKYAYDSLDEQKNEMIEEAKGGWEKRLIVLPRHRKDSLYGENLAGWGGGRSDNADMAVTFWLREKMAFDKLNATNSYKVGDEMEKTELDDKGLDDKGLDDKRKERPIIVGHYTAIVWRNTTHLGAAKLVFELADEKRTVRKYVAVICNYDPPGNVLGERPF
jgi:pathogenesis-related protein 1